MRNIHIDKFNHEVIVSVNQRIYSADYVMISAQAFTNTCWVYFDTGQIYTIVYIKPKNSLSHEELELLGYEFFNYLLGTIQNEK